MSVPARRRHEALLLHAGNWFAVPLSTVHAGVLASIGDVQPYTRRARFISKIPPARLCLASFSLCHGPRPSTSTPDVAKKQALPAVKTRPVSLQWRVLEGQLFMASPGPTPDYRVVYGYGFRWTPDHQTADKLHPLIYTYDKVASDAVARLDAIHPHVPPDDARKDSQETCEPKQQRKHRDLFRLLRQNVETDEKIGRLWNEVTSVPEWVDWEQIARGQDVFWRYAGASITAVCLGCPGNLPSRFRS